MKKISYKIISVILAVLMVTSCMPIVAFAGYGFRNKNISENGTNEICTWSYDSSTKTLYIDGKDIYTRHDNYLPTYVENQTDHFEYCYKDFEHIVFGKNVESIKNVYMGTDYYPNLKTVEFEEGSKLITIGDGVFASTNITSIDLPNSLKKIEIEAFASSKLESITIPASVIIMEDGVFAGCQNLATINFEERTEELKMGEADFAETAITSFDFNDIKYSGTKVPNDFFNNCGKLTSVTFTDNMTEIDDGAFADCVSLTEFDFTPFTSIGEWAFSNVGLTEVDAPNVTEIGYQAFEACDYLETVNLPNLTSLGNFAFEHCTALKNVNIPKVTNISRYAFSNCTALESFDFSNVIQIGNNAFNSSGITSANLPRATKIDYRAFQNCKKLESVKCGEYLATIRYNAFDSCTALTEFEFSQALKTIEEYAFRNCEKLDVGPLPSSVSTLGVGAFQNSGVTSVYVRSDLTYTSTYSGCKKLKNVTFSSNLTSISSGAFEDCYALTDVDMSKNTKITNISTHAFDGCKSLENVMLPPNLITISDFAFFGCSSLKTINLPANLNTIGNYAFQNCKLLSNVEFPQGLTSIGESAFYGCSSIKELLFYPSLESISSCAFANCTSLDKVVVTRFYEKFGTDVFKGASPVIYGAAGSYANKYANNNDLIFKAKGSGDLSEEIEALIEEKDPVSDAISGTWKYGTWHFSDNLSVLYINGEGEALSSGTIYMNNGASYESFRELCYKKGAKNVDIVFGEGITKIGTKFLGTNSSYGVTIDYLTLPDSLVELNANAFNGVTVNKVFFGKNLKTIGDSAFYNCSVSELNFDKNSVLETVGYNAFRPNKLTKFNFPTSVTSFGNYALYGAKFESVDLTGFSPDTSYGTNLFASTPIKQVNLGSIKTISANMFNGCSNLKELVIPDTVKTIGGNAFSSCVSLEKVTLPDNLKYLPSYCFSSNTALKTINLDNVENIDEGCFSYCNNLGSLTLPNVYVINQKAFRECKGLYYVSAPKLTTIMDSAFYYCSVLRTVLAPNVSYIGTSAFSNCARLDNFDLDNENIKSISNTAFYGTGFENVTIYPDIIYGSSAFSSCKNLKKVTIKNTVTKLPSSMFSYCDSLKNIVFEKDCQLEAIGQSAFRYCHGIEKIILPPSVKTVGAYAFERCNNLQYAVLSNKVESVGLNAFYYCENLKYMVIPKFNVALEGYPAATNSTVISAVNSRASEYYTNSDTVNFVSAIGNNYINAFPELSFVSDYNANGDYDVEVRNDSVYGIWENGSWGYSADQTQLYISGSGTLTNTFKDAKGNDISFTDILSHEITPLTVYIGGGITDVENDFANGETGAISNLVIQTGVTAIGDNAFKGVTIYKLTLKDDVTAIGAHAFQNCGMTNMDYNSTLAVETIGDYAFYGNKLGSAMYADSLRTIGAHAFENNNITGFNGNNKAIKIGDYAFSNNKLSSVTIANSNLVGSYAFANSTAVNMEVTLPDSITAIPDGLFANCAGIKTLTLPESVKTIGYEAFKGISIKQITFEDNIQSISSKAFYGCEYLKEVVIGKNVKSIGSAAFGACLLLDLVNFLNDDVDIYTDTVDKSKGAIGFSESGNVISMTKIQGSADSTALRYATVMGLPFLTTGSTCENRGYISRSATNYDGPLSCTWEYYENIDMLYISGTGMMSGNWYFKDGTPIDAPKASKVIVVSGVTGLETSFAPIGAKEIQIPNTVTDIYDCFQNCDELEYISIPDSVQTMNNETFKGCKNLKSLAIGTGLKAIPKHCAEGCTNLKYLFLYGSRSIEEFAFRNCSSLQTITIPNTVETIKQNAFENCHSVFNLTFGKGLTSVGSRAFANMPLLDTINYLGSVNYVDSSAFDGCSTSTSGVDVILNDDVEVANVDGVRNIEVNSISIGKKFREFANVPNIPALKEYAVPYGNENGYTAYKGCLYKNNVLTNAPQAMDSVDIKQGTKSIGEYAFRYSKANTVRIPDGVKTVENYAFYKAQSLKSVRFPSTVESIGNSAFEECIKLKTVSIPFPCKSIGDRAFKNCKLLASVLLPEGLVTVGDDCFNGCVAMESIVFPQSVVSIGGGALAFNPNLKSIYVWNASLGYNIFYQSSIPMIYTLAGSITHGDARTKKYPVTAYTDEEIFADLCFEMLDELSGFIGYCTDGHGDIEWLTVYEGDCENDGYEIGVCEYCSEILDERHTYATGHIYTQIAYLKETATDYGIRVLRCDTCGDRYTTYYKPLGEYTPSVGVYSVSGKVDADTGKEINNENTALENAEIVIDGNVVARTDENGHFRFKMKTGVYLMEIRYIYGFTRYVGLSITDHDIKLSDYEPITIVACDFNKDGMIDAADQSLFMLVTASKEGDTSYLKFVDLNNDGYINAKDYVIIGRFYGQTAGTYQYPQRNIL